MFTLNICTNLNGYSQVNIKILLIQSYHTTCVSFSCEFNWNKNPIYVEDNVNIMYVQYKSHLPYDIRENV